MSKPSRQRQLIERLLEERGIRRYALFLVQREGLTLPGGVEAVSGFALDGDGRVHGFWLDWDHEKKAYTLAPFYEVDQPESAFPQDQEYRSARRTLGLDV